MPKNWPPRRLKKDEEIEPKIVKLPVWAQKYIEELKRERDHFISELDTLLNERNTQVGDLTNTTWETGMDGEHSIPDHATVAFYKDRGMQYKFNAIQVKHEGDGTIYVAGGGGQSACCLPNIG